MQAHFTIPHLPSFPAHVLHACTRTHARACAHTHCDYPSLSNSLSLSPPSYLVRSHNSRLKFLPWGGIRYVTYPVTRQEILGSILVFENLCHLIFLNLWLIPSCCTRQHLAGYCPPNTRHRGKWWLAIKVTSWTRLQSVLYHKCLLLCKELSKEDTLIPLTILHLKIHRYVLFLSRICFVSFFNILM